MTTTATTANPSITAALAILAGADAELAAHSLTCTEVDALAVLLHASGASREDAAAWIGWHIMGEDRDEPGDSHYRPDLWSTADEVSAAALAYFDALTLHDLRPNRVYAPGEAPPIDGPLPWTVIEEDTGRIIGTYPTVGAATRAAAANTDLAYIVPTSTIPTAAGE